MYNKILLAIDESSDSLRAVEKVIELQNNWNCKVIMIHSIKHPKKVTLTSIALPSGGGSYYVSEQKLLNYAKEKGEKLLYKMKEVFNKKNLPVETRLIIDEHPEDYIKRIVKEEHFDLAVIGTKGIHSKIKQIIMGSVAQRVVKYTPCDILIVR